MNICNSLQFVFSSIRYKAYRVARRITLGPLCGKALGSNLFRDLEESSANPELAKRIFNKRLLSSAKVQIYPFPETYPPWFCRSEAFAARYQYMLSDVTVSPFTSAMWIPNVAFLQQSIGSLPRMFCSGRGAIETLLPTTTLTAETPLCVGPSKLGYYHWLLEAVPEILHAKDYHPNCKILLGPHPRLYATQSLAFLGFDDETFIHAQTPVHVHKAILTSRWVNSGFIPQADIDVLRKNISPRLRPSRTDRKIYISRSRSRNRTLCNEPELERALAPIGFEILYFEEMNFEEQMMACCEAQHLVAPHGAGLSNMIAGRTGMHVHELLSVTWPNTCYAKLAVQLGFNYNYTLLHPNSNGQIEINVQSTINDICSSMELP